MASKRIAFRAVHPLDEELAARSDRPEDDPMGVLVQGQLERYFTFLSAQLSTVQLTEERAGFLCDLLNGTLIGETWMRSPGRLLAFEIQEADPGMDEKWGVDRADLAAWAQVLHPGQALAVLDAVERFWRHTGEADTLTERLTAVGLLRSTPAQLER